MIVARGLKQIASFQKRSFSSTTKKLQLKGCFAPIPASFKNDGNDLDLDAVKFNVQRWKKSSLDGILVLGSNGEFPMTTSDERLKLVETVSKTLDGSKQLMVGTGCESTKETIWMTNQVANLGAQTALLLPPFYYKAVYSDSVLEEFFTDVANAAKIPVLIYNMPANTGLNLSSKLISKLSKHPNIIGCKDSGGNITQISEIIRDSGKDFTVFAGSASFLFTSLAMGAKGGTMALANVLPEMCSLLYKYASEGNLKAAQELQQTLLEPNFLVTAKFGVPGLKAALELFGYKGTQARKPLKPLGGSDLKVVQDVFSKLKETEENLTRHRN